MSIGFAFSGGGTRGAVHIGVLKAMEENGLYPDLISGTSSGSIIASLYSVGYKAKEIEEIFLENAKGIIIDFDFNELFMYIKSLMLNMNKKVDGFIKGERIKKVLNELYKQKSCTNINQTMIPLAIPAADVNTAKTVMFISDRKGLMNDDDIEYYDDINLVSAVRASISYPAVFKPCMVKGKRLIDGGVKDNVPIEILKRMGADKVFAVNLGYAGKANSHIDDVLEIITQTIDIMAYQITKQALKKADYVLMPQVYDVKIPETGRLDECIQRGYEAAMNKIDDIKKALNDIEA